MPEIDTQRLAADLAATRKYRYAAPETRERVAAWAAGRARSRKDAAKQAKRKLHQVYGAYFDGLDRKMLEHVVDEAAGCEDGEQLRALCWPALARHASTAERLPLLDTVYAEIFARTGMPGTLLDAACGLNWLALPWMGLAAGTRYVGIDIDTHLAELGNRFLRAFGLPGEVACHDILSRPWSEPADVALLFKALPCLEQQRKGAARDVLAALPADVAVVSFPARSLGGREKGMRSHYGEFTADLAAELGMTLDILDYPEESFHILRRKA
jgi:16S rRNA (guanine(1405)-N(7))-methyltransferase